jgi:hypothetical protein
MAKVKLRDIQEEVRKATLDSTFVILLGSCHVIRTLKQSKERTM